MSSIMKGIVDEGDWTGGIINWKKEVTSKHGPDVTFKKRKLPGVSGKTDTYATNSEGKVVGVYQHHNDMGRVLSETDAIKGADGKRCWKGKRYAGTENGKDKCIPVKEESDEEALERLKNNKSREKWMADADLEYMRKRHSKNKPVKNEAANPAQQAAIAIAKKKKAKTNEGVIVGHDANDPEVAILGGAGTMSLSRLKKKAHQEALQLADDIANGKYSASSYNMKQLHNTLNTIVAAEKEMEKLYFGEAREMSPALRAAQKNLVDLSTGEVRRREASRKAAEKGQRAASKYLKSLDKKPSTDEVWRKIEDAIANSFPDGDPYDTLWPWLNRNGLDNDDVVRAARKQGYKDLWDYWNVLSRDIGHEVMNEMPDTSGPVGTQPVGWRRTDLDEELSQADVDAIARFADKLYKKLGIDVTFTKHFMDRVNDERNGKPISGAELVRLFKKEYERWGKQVAQLGPDVEGTFKDLTTDINLPFVLRWDRDEDELDLVAKTVMRKKNFKTWNQEFPVDEDTSYASGMGQGGNAGESYRKFKPKSAGTFNEDTETKWEVAIEYGPTAHHTAKIKVSAPDSETAQSKALAQFKKKFPDRRGMVGDCTKVNEEQLDEKCWDGYKQVGMKKKGDKNVPNCVPKESSIMKGLRK